MNGYNQILMLAKIGKKSEKNEKMKNKFVE